MPLTLGNETGSLMNFVMSISTAPKPKVGMGATILCWTDRHACTIVKLTPKTVTVQRDKATRIDKNGMSDCQEYSYEKDLNGYTRIFRMTKRGWRDTSGNGLMIGNRDEHYDFSF